MTMQGQQDRLHTRVKAVWCREQFLRFTEGALVFLRWALATFLVGGLIDWLSCKWTAGIPVGGRIVMLAVVLGVPLYKAWKAGWRHIRPFSATRTALQIEEHHGDMESLLVTAMQLKDASQRHGTSDALCDVTCRKAEESAGAIKPTKTMPFHALRRPAVGALIAMVVFGLVAITSGPFLMAGLARIFAPWRDVRYPTRTQLQLMSGDVVVQEGKPVRLAARVSGVVPRKAKIALRTGAKKARVRKLAIVKGECEYIIETAFRGFEYRLTAGDGRTAWHKVQVIAAPNIERAAVQLDFPAYTKRPTETVEALTLTVPETTAIKWTLSLDRAVREAKLNLAGDKSVPMAISPDGLTVTFDQVAADSRAYSFSWVEREHGFAFKSPSYYLQVAPDRPPRVELTSPKRNLYALLGRPVNLAFRGRDDHGVAESVVTYRVDKTEEETVRFSPDKPIDGSEQTIDWDYRSVLTNLLIGQTVTFAVELADAYPGDKGPHRVRSETRRIQFMSREDYLAQVERQKKRMLSQLRTIYREERDVYEVVMRLDPADPIFIQTCQLEAVRQGLMRERINKLAGRMLDMTMDLAANGITNRSLTASLGELRTDMLSISSNHVLKAAGALRALASESTGKGGHNGSAKAHAAHMVNSSARELGLLVFQLGYEDAADVMAREMHAAAQTQASLRLRTTMLTKGSADLAGEQERLGKWLTRLFAASPKEKESTVEDALIEFTLTRLVKKMVNGGIDQRLHKAAGFVREGATAEAARLQEDVLAALLKSEFRLRVGSEREALVEAWKLFRSQAETLGKLRTQAAALDADAFEKRRPEFVRSQTELHQNLQLLLMPEIPSRRTRLFDDVLPSPPQVADLRATADAALKHAAARLEAGEREAVGKEQLKAEEAFVALVDAVTKRIAVLTERVRLQRIAYGAKDINDQLDRFGERQLSLLEKTEDAAAEGEPSAYLGAQQEGLKDAVDELRMELAGRIKWSSVPSEHSLSVPARLEQTVALMQKAVPLLKANKPGEAKALQKAAGVALTGAQALLAEHGKLLSRRVAIVSSTEAAVKPSPYVGEIAEEQRDMLAFTRKTKPEDLPAHAIPQKNLVHAVDAMLNALDPIAHHIQAGTKMLFAKEDMESAGIAMEEKDSVEALDAQEYIVESLDALRGKIDTVIRQYLYLLEIAEAIHETSQESVLIREAQRQLREQAVSGSDAKVLAKGQGALRARMAAYSELSNRITGLGLMNGVVKHMAEVEGALKGGDTSAAAKKMELVEQALKSAAENVEVLTYRLTVVLAPPAPAQEVPVEVVLLKQVLAMAAKHKTAHRKICAVKPNQLPGFQAALQEFVKQCDPFIAQAKSHKNPVVEDTSQTRGRGEPEVVQPPKRIPPANLHLKLVAAKGSLSKAAAAAKASDGKTTVAEQKNAVETLRYFVTEYTYKFIIPLGPPPPEPPAPSRDFEEGEDEFNLFMPGAVTGTKPPDGNSDGPIIGERNRAALNENFARELPLEYRAILKDYYERLAR